MNPAVSIILPCYQVGGTLGDCLDSLLAQTLQAIEIICVDDGSTDQTPHVLAAYAHKDSRVRVITQGQNAGVSGARNLGIEGAQGDYIGFCDGDDWAEPGMYQALYEAAQGADAQVVFCGVVKEYPAGPRRVLLPWEEGQVMDATGIRRVVVPAMIALPRDSEDLPVSGYTPRTLFRRETLGRLRFNPGIRYAEDLLFIVQALLGAQRFAAVAGCYYHYRFHAGSATQRYMPGLGAQHEACHRALRETFRAAGLTASLAGPMAIRERKAILTQVVNLCLPGTPYPMPFARAKAIRRLIRGENCRTAFRGLSLKGLSPKLRLKFGLIQYRLALPLAVLYTYFYHAR